MNREEALKKLEKCARSDDPEVAHEAADEVLCDLLTTLGFGDVVDAYKGVERWFA